MLDPATLAAVRERIALLHGRKRYFDLATTEGYDLALVDIERAVQSLAPKEPTMATDENMDARAAPPLTEARVREIAREEATLVVAERCPNPHPRRINQMPDTLRDEIAAHMLADMHAMDNATAEWFRRQPEPLQRAYREDADAILAIVRKHATSDAAVELAWEAHVRTEAPGKMRAAIVAALGFTP